MTRQAYPTFEEVQALNGSLDNDLRGRIQELITKIALSEIHEASHCPVSGACIGFFPKPLNRVNGFVSYDGRFVTEEDN